MFWLKNKRNNLQLRFLSESLVSLHGLVHAMLVLLVEYAQKGSSLNIFYCQILYSNGVGSQVLTTLVTTLPLQFKHT